ncbi:coiled-coil domain-containing protein 57-like [Gigantopelta aegis]|uniref:coiled-coil domain-containing protein 57-like n=1 Tax=Gigantopelta aegis TaxID=1735272 RepID=UPI001B8883B4|nr:coiled-coil domain-containing protein 57-like [Gigantopelta aegis]XP_041363904.1 coiled-coil domain-containing protein 57-like [Gigantopelta aegis]
MENQDPSSWKQLAEQKEREWKEITHLRITALEAVCEEKEKLLAEERSRFTQLKEDFKYNLKLLNERDQELEQYDVKTSDYRAHLNVKNAEVSELKIKIDDLNSVIRREVQSREELQIHYQQRLREKQAEIDSFKCSKDSEIEKERKEFELFKRDLQRRITEVEDEIEIQKRELSSGFDEAMRKREHEFRVKLDDMSAKVLEYELKAKLLAKELEMMKSAQQKHSKEYNKVEHSQRALEKLVKEKEWELADTTSMKDARISELENKLQQTETVMKRMQQDFQRKHAEIDRAVKEKEASLASLKDAYSEREQTLQNSIRELQSQLEDRQIELRQLQWTNEDLVKNRDMQIHKLKNEILELKEKWDKHVADISRSQVSTDVQLEQYKDINGKLKADLQQKKLDIERYQRELVQAAEREAALERGKVQLALDWQNRYEDCERSQYEKSEELIKQLTQARDEALATLKEKDRELEQRDMYIRALQRDKNVAMATLKEHNIPLDKNLSLSAADKYDSNTDELFEQNQNLREVIRQMRQQMELLGHEIPSKLDLNTNRDQDYVSAMEKELRKLKKRNRQLESQLEIVKKHGRLLPEPHSDNEALIKEVQDSGIRDYIKSLNDAIGSLRSEKVELSALVKRQQVRIQHLESTGNQLSKQPREKQIEIDQLQYEVNAAGRRHQAESASLRQQISDLELQLMETRKEADEYYRASLERNMEVTALRNEVSSLKVDLAEKRPAANFGAQELMIQQLEDELLRFRTKPTLLGDCVPTEVNRGQGLTTNAAIEELQHKLRNAARQIAQLARDKQQLIEMGNRLRAQLKEAGVPPQAGPPRMDKLRPMLPDSSIQKSTQPLSKEFLNKLNQLEKLQYQLTKQELQYAQRFPGQFEMKVSESTDKQLQSPPQQSPPQTFPNASLEIRPEYTSLHSTQRSMNETENSDDVPLDNPVWSSLGAESLQEVWKMLDERPSPSLVTPRTPHRGNGELSPRANKSVEQSRSSAEWLVSGTKTELAARSNPEKRFSPRTAGKYIRKGPDRLHVRNYNARDDASIK